MIRRKDFQYALTYIKISDGQQLRASMESNRFGLGELDTKLFTVPVSVLQEVTKNEKAAPISEFCFYLQGDESQVLTSILETIDAIKQSKTPIILGKRASQGLNKYYITDIDDQVTLNRTDSNRYLNLGMLLPDQIDYEASVLKLFTSERRPFSMYGGWNQSFQKCFISFIDCGSVIALHGGIKNAGKCVKSPFNKERDIVFGNAFLYPVSLKEDAK